MIKAGRTAAAAKAAASHTGSLAGSDEALDAAFRRCGVLRVDHISDLFYMAEDLDKQPRPRGPRLTILTNAGGPGVLATDALLAEGGSLAELVPETIAALNQVLPAHWSHQNSIDIIGDAGPERYAKAVEIASSDGLLVALTPQGMTSPAEIAERLKPFAKLNGKPILASWMGGVEVAVGEAILHRAGAPPQDVELQPVPRPVGGPWRIATRRRALHPLPHAADHQPEYRQCRRFQSLDLKVTWGTYPNDQGHVDYPGCFRCHDDSHSTSDKKTNSQDCGACHQSLAVEEAAPEILKMLGLEHK